MHRKIVCFIFTVLVCLTNTFAQSTAYTVKGIVFQDNNQNGIKDRAEKGLKNVPISNGEDIVYTDRHGYYTLNAKEGNSVFPILPADLALIKAGENIKNAAFFYNNAPLGEERQVNFPIIKEKQPKSFKIGAIGDIQVGNIAEVTYANKSIFEELLGRNDINFNIILGDLLNDKPSLFPTMKEMISQLPSSSWTVPGNHDRNTLNSQNMDDQFNAHFGASTYAFNYGNVHFIVFNNVYATGKHSYEGRLTESQLNFLVNDLKNVRPDQQIVISQHIPMLYTRNKKEVFDILQGYSKVLILSGHTHQVSRHFYNNGSIHELVTGAPSGMWWTGEKDWLGVPNALMQDGSPRNYFTVDFNENGYSFQFKGIGMDANHQMDIRLDSTAVIANIYGGSDSTEVWLQIDDNDWMRMEKKKMIPLSISDIIEKNKSKVYPTLGSRANPLRKRASQHIWIASFDKQKEGMHKIRVRAKDSYGFQAEGVILHNVSQEK